jgi:serine/threonine protein kinase
LTSLENASEYANSSTDVTLRNIVFTLPESLQSLSRKELLDTFGGVPLVYPIKLPSEPKPGWPQYLVKPPDPALLFGLSTTSDQSSIRLVDFTESFKLPFSSLHLPGTPVFEAAPEILLRAHSAITEKIDVWAFSCVAYEVFATEGSQPLHGYMGLVSFQIEEIFKELHNAGGGIPDEFKQLWMSQGKDISFNDSGPQNSTPGSYHGCLGETLRTVMETVGVTEADVEGLRVLWRMALLINPLERAPMTEMIGVLQGIWG